MTRNVQGTQLDANLYIYNNLCIYNNLLCKS